MFNVKYFMVYLIGASGHAKVILEILEKRNIKIGRLIDADPTIDQLFDYVVDRDFPPGFNPEKNEVIISIGDNSIRKRIVSENDFRYGLAIHPNTTISQRASIGLGTVVMAGTNVNAGAQIGRHIILNTNCTIDHDCVIDDFVHISPNAALAGGIVVGEGTHIGIGACIIPGIKIGKWCTIGAGAVIIRDVPDGSTVVGNPGKIIKQVSFAY